MRNQLQEVLLDSLKMWQPDMCVVCCEAEGDTIQCQDCHRFLHEECDSDYMQNSRCQTCRQMKLAANEDDNEDERVDYGDVNALPSEEADEEGGSSDDEDLSGFVVNDEHVSWSSGEQEASEPSYHSPTPERKMKKRKKNKGLVIESSEGSGMPYSRFQEQDDEEDDDEVILHVSPIKRVGDTVEKKKKKPRNIVIDLANSPVKWKGAASEESSGGSAKRKNKKKKHKKKRTKYIDDDE